MIFFACAALRFNQVWEALITWIRTVDWRPELCAYLVWRCIRACALRVLVLRLSNRVIGLRLHFRQSGYGTSSRNVFIATYRGPLPVLLAYALIIFKIWDGAWREVFRLLVLASALFKNERDRICIRAASVVVKIETLGRDAFKLSEVRQLDAIWIFHSVIERFFIFTFAGAHVLAGC